MKDLCIWITCALFISGHGLTEDTVKPDVAEWMDAALAGNSLLPPKQGDELARNEIEAHCCRSRRPDYLEIQFLQVIVVLAVPGHERQSVLHR